MAGLHLGLSLGLGGRGGGGGFVATTRIVGTRGGVPVGVVNIATAARARTCRSRHFIGGQDCTELRLAFGGYFGGTAAGEVNVGNDHTLECAIEIPTASTQTVQLTFSASNSVTITDGAALVISDAVLPAAFGLSAFPANEQIWVRHSRVCVNPGALPINGTSGANPAIAGESAVSFDPDVDGNQVNAIGALVTTGSTRVSYAGRLLPLAILGKTVAAELAVLGIGDSIVLQLDDTNGDGVNGAGGWFQRGLVSVNGRHVPYVLGAISSERADYYANGSTKRQQLYPYVTHAITDHGGADINVGTTPANLLIDQRVIWNALAAAGVQRVEQMLLTPHTTSTDAFATLANQTLVEDADKTTANNNILAEVGTNGLNASFDNNTTIADSGEPGKWVVNGTPNFATDDGVHPGPTHHGLMAGTFSARVATWTAI